MSIVESPPAEVRPDDLGILANNQQLAEWLYKAIRSGASAYESVPKLVDQIVVDGKWMHRYAMHHQRVIHMSPDQFLRFVRNKPPEGLDAAPEQVRLFLKEPRLLDLWDELTVGKRGGNNNPEGHNQHKEDTEEVNADNISVDQMAPKPKEPRERKHGTSRQYAIRKLRNDAPEIHAEVMTGDLSPHAGMIKAGFRIPIIQVPADPRRAGRLLAKHFDPDQFEELTRAYREARGDD